MRLVEVKILYNADYKDQVHETDTQEHIDWFISTLKRCPDVVHISKTVIEDGDDDD